LVCRTPMTWLNLVVMRRPWWNQVRCSGSSRIAASACAPPRRQGNRPYPSLPKWNQVRCSGSSRIAASACASPRRSR
jgi:hypothetical protein